MPELIKLPAVGRFFNTPELLNMVFKSLENDEDRCFHVVNAQVSKMWSELALDYIWHELEDLLPAFQVLAPMDFSPETESFEFITMPSAAQWRHFEKYSHRVRSITHRPTDPEINRSVFHHIATTRTNLRIFPNLHTLHWNESLDPDLSVIFMHSGISKLFLDCPDGDRLTTAGILPDPSRTPGITHLRLHMVYHVYTMDTEITPLLSSLHSLEELEILANHFTPTMAQSLSHLQYLRTIKCLLPPRFKFLDVRNVFSGICTLEKGAFPALEELRFEVEFSDAIRFIEAANAPKTVETLQIHSASFEGRPDHETLITDIAARYKSLTSLDLSCNEQWLFPVHNGSNEALTIDSLKPLLILPNIIYLKITYYAWELRDEDFKLIALAFPLLEYFNLIARKVFKTASNLTLHAILPFAHHCPHLRLLGFPLKTAGLSISQSQEAFQCAPRMKLRRFELGRTDFAATPDEVAFLLSWIFPKNCLLSCDSENGQWLADVGRLRHLFYEAQEGKKLL